MTTGYDARPAGRRTFADEGIAPVQTSTGASGNSQRASLVGGETIGGAPNADITQPGNMASGLGAYFDKFIEPAVQRKQQEQFFKGYTEAQAGRALEELTDNDSPLTKIFGPSGFAEGAQYFAGREAISKWSQEQLTDLDNLKRMAPEELSKHMSASMTAMMTGDPYADQLIQSGLLEAQGPVIQTITKARHEWEQTNMTKAQARAAREEATALQNLLKTNAALGEEADNNAVLTMGQRYLGGIQKPDGMWDENFQSFLYNHIREAMSDGNFYAVELLREKGVMDVLTDDQRRKLEGDYDRYGEKLLDSAMGQPDIVERLLKLEYRVQQNDLIGGEQISSAEAMAEKRAINAELRRRTGVNKDLFDGNDILATGKSPLAIIVGRAKRLEARQQALADRDADRAADRAERIDEAAGRIAAANLALQSGDINGYIAAGGSNSDIETAAYQQYTQGNLGVIANAYTQSGKAFSLVTNQVQSMARSGIGENYTKATASAHQVWQQFNNINPALAKAYFGEYYFPFATFDRMVSTSGPEIASRDAFSREGGYSIERIPPAQRREAEAQLTAVIADTGAKWYNPLTWGTTLTGISQEQLKQAITDEYARLSAFSPRPPEEMAKQAYNQAINSGRYERYGNLGWIDTRGGQTIGQSLGLKPVDAAAVVQGLLADKLKKVGVNTFEGVRVIRTGGVLMLEHYDDGLPRHQVVTYGELQERAQAHVEWKRRSAQAATTQDHAAAQRDAARHHAERRIPGETTAQRVIRINRENAAWQNK